MASPKPTTQSRIPKVQIPRPAGRPFPIRRRPSGASRRQESDRVLTIEAAARSAPRSNSGGRATKQRPLSSLPVRCEHRI